MAADEEPDPDEALEVDTDGWPAITPRTCAAGTPHAECIWAKEPCAGCKAMTEQGIAEFKAAVARGEFDERGYEPGDRKFRQESLF